MVKGVIFDFDGVIVESEPLFLDSIIMYLRQFNIETNYDDLTYLLGMVMDDIVVELKNRYALADDIATISKETAEVYESIKSLDRFSLINGVKEFLDKCQRMGIKMCVASSSSMDYLLMLIRHFGLEGYFEFVLTGDDFEKCKPDPQIYNTAAARLAIDKNELIIIEDAYNGILAAKRANIFTYGLKASVIKQDTSLADKQINGYYEIELS
ncbi:MAG: HAD family hydrolase [Erysipelotrichaceae bacterium]